MKHFFTACLVLVALMSVTALAQEEEKSVREQMDELKGKVDGMDETVKTLESDVSGLKKIKVSGYLQLNWEKSEKEKGFAADPYDSKDYDMTRFRVRRSRLKFNYDAGVSQMVVQGDFSNSGFELKDAYLEFSEPWLKMFTLRAGVFNRPNYEVEYSSSQRESPERSTVIASIYPKERDLGAMLTFAPEDLFTLQFAAFNNTFKGTYAQNNPNFGPYPLYFMTRVTKSFILGDLGLDLGVHARFGNVRTNNAFVRESDEPIAMRTAADSSAARTGTVGGSAPKTWFGVEAQLYYDFLGGMKIMGEYIMGQDVNELSTAAPLAAIRKRDFMGWYVYLVKNLGTEFQFALKYDSYNPNTSISSDVIDNSAELAVNTLGLGIHNYTFPNVRLTLWYDSITTTTNDRLLKADPKDNLLTIRAQYKF